MWYLEFIKIYTFVSLYLLHPVRAAEGYTPKLYSREFQKIENIFYFDDSPVLVLQDMDDVYQSNDNGFSWDPLHIPSADGGVPIVIQQIDFDNQLGFIFTNGNRQFYTKDQGKNWKFFDLPEDGFTFSDVKVNYAKHNYMLFRFSKCYSSGFESTVCNDTFYYSKDGLATKPVKIDVDGLAECTFAKSNENFNSLHDDLIVCVKREYDTFGFPETSQVVATKDFFNTVLVPKNDAMKNAHVMDIEVTNSFLVATVKSDRYSKNAMIDLYISKDGLNFKKSFFEKQIRNWSYVLLPSAKNSLHLALLGSATGSRNVAPSADIYRSDSQGVYFKKIFSNVRSSVYALSVISKVQGIDGAWIAGANEGIDENTMMPLTKSKITLDDGDSWSFLKAVDDPSCHGNRDCSVNLIWMSERAGNGEIVTGPTPGILMGIGSTGKYLPQGVDDLHTYISRDGGLSWKMVADYPSTFAFADFGNIAVSVPINVKGFMDADPSGATDNFAYSTDQGKTWSDIQLGTKVIPYYLVTSKDGTAHQMVLVGIDVGTKKFVAITIDFSGAFKRKCGKGDFEEWYARRDPNTDDPICIYGQREKFNRRKQDADCFASELYKDIEVIGEPCKCTTNDTECDFGFVMNESGACTAISNVMVEEVCKGKNSNRKVKLTSKRLIPGDPCSGGYKIPKNDFTINCKKVNENAEAERIHVAESNIDEKVVYFLYLDRDPNNDGIPDETLLVVTESMTLYVSYDGGSTFLTPAALSNLRGEVLNIFTNPYFPNSVYVATRSGDIYYSTDRASTFDRFQSPYSAVGESKFDMSFSKNDVARFIWYSHTDCDSAGNCRSRAAITNDNGQSFTHMLDNARKCHFADSIFDAKNYDVNDNLIICEQRSSNYYRLVSSIDNFATQPTVILDKIIGSTSSGEFLIVARLNGDNSLTAFVSVDGSNYAEAKFPQDIEVTRQTAYTILNVNSKQVFMHVTTSSEDGYELGALLKSNYNGTLYVTSIRNVNRNREAYVDFESVQGLEGISIVNTVINPAKKKEESKLLRTMMSHNDGASWSPLAPPSADSGGKRYNCKGKDCSLNLHSYTERVDPVRDTYSSGSALGMLFGLGNIGQALKPLDDESTALFFTRDAGLTWKEVKKGQYIWEFGDQGTILVIARSDIKTSTISYSLDQGQSWKDYQFTKDEYFIDDLATVPSDTARRFMLLTRDDGGSSKVFTLDFSDVQQRQCVLDIEDKLKHGDFEYWTPKHPGLGDGCLFGHESEYVRRKPSATDCFIGAAPLSKGYRSIRNCSCTRNDFECDYNFEMASDGTCKLIKGLSSRDNSAVCSRDDKVLEYWEPTGYRRIPLSTCDGGLELDKWVSHPCPGKEKDYKKNHDIAIDGVSSFLIVIIPLVAFLAMAAFVYDKGIRRNGGFQRFGEIRLDDDDNLHLVEENSTDKIVNKIVMAGVYAFSFGTVIVRQISAFFRRGVLGVRGENVTSASSFFNDRIVDNDEDSLFRYADDEDDAREIDSFLDHGVENDVEDDEENFGDPVTGSELPQPPQSPTIADHPEGDDSEPAA
ncbi:DEKNAAC100867 [Brettanomyces naardenensis]|uniref:DEKNAAC100867 n=1 Tax=Brettanomyces naardenensis TaxID=13370 RepID=A0A448YFC7_BRENA|nr:DEKNAAC100867 [Brettanomyces naardenensis]